ncbi:MAG TPA: DUF308 domain-containing protein [Solirubrobacteraceae bacterium]|nr:DUF308 domain-containing protein [Solirubrobacteraceae bacterium]
MSEDIDELEGVAEFMSGPPASRTITNIALADLARYWWVELLLGVFWLVIAVVVLKFNHASVATVGVLIGVMFLIFAAEEFALAVLDRGATRWLWAFFGVLLVAAGVVSLIHPRETFAGFADILGFVFLVIGVIWTIQAFAERAFNNLWWLTLIGGILLIVLAFWTSGQFFLERAYTLLIFAGIWALTKGITDIVRAFEIRKLASS